MKEDDFLKSHQDSMTHSGIFDEHDKDFILRCITLRFNTEIIKNWYASDLIANGDKFIVKWTKRLFPLTKKELKEKYGR